MLPANAGVKNFVDWDDFRASFRKEFFPLHAEAVATNILEGSAYFQGSRNVDDSTMAVGCPDDLDPEAWFEATVRTQD